MHIDVEKLKKNISITDIIGEYINLQKASRGEMRGICPFHSDDDPSLYVNEKKGYFNCFGCDASGDAIEFIELIEGIDFTDALERIIDKKNIDKLTLDSTGEYDFSELLDLIQEDKKERHYFDEKILRKYTEYTHQYLINLGFKKETLNFFQIGFCADPHDELYNRVTFPWREVEGNLVGITGRDVTGKKPKKYTAKTGSQKENVLFNLNNAKHFVAENNNKIIVVEDEKSVMRLWEFGYRNAVALGNNDINNRHWLLCQFADTIVLAFDNDEEGKRGRNKAIKRISPLCNIEVIKYEDKHKDIAEMRDKSNFDRLYKNRDVLNI